MLIVVAGFGHTMDSKLPMSQETMRNPRHFPDPEENPKVIYIDKCWNLEKLHGEGRDLRKVERHSDKAWTPGKVGISGKGQLPHKRLCLDFRQEFSHGTKQLWHTWDRPKEGSPLLQESITGDQGPTHSGGGEGHLDKWSRDGHRWRLGAGAESASKD